MSTPFVSTFTTIGDAPMAPARKKARHEYFVIGHGPIMDKLFFPELDDDVTPLHMKKFPSIRPRRQTSTFSKKGADQQPTSSSVVPFPFLDDDLMMIRNPLLQLTMSTTYEAPIKLRQRRSNDNEMTMTKDHHTRSS